jgi:poly-gamma-glutamate synthesis protein (capsule biosynthesis protein)
MSDRIVNEAADEIVVMGDLVLDVPDPDHWLSGIVPALRSRRSVIGHLEVPHCRGAVEEGFDVPAPGADPDHLAALSRGGVTMLSLAGNHMADCGAAGIAQTIATLDGLGIVHAGAGADIAAARRPAVSGGIALLSYNCVGPQDGWAGVDSAGFAYLRIDTADGSPIVPTAPLTSVSDEAVAMLKADVANADSDLVIVALHKGIVHTPARLASYERAIAHAAIDAGADAVVSHHAHIVRGIEFHRGKPIFHGLGNGCVVTLALSPDQDHPGRAEWARRRKTLFGFEPDPAYSLAPFHPEAVNAMLGRLVRRPDGSLAAGIIPVHVEAPGRPVLAVGDRAREIARYIEKITIDAGLPPIRIDEDFMVHA